MACLVVSSTSLRGQLLAGLLAQCCPMAIADVCDSAATAIVAIDRCSPELVVFDGDGDGDDCERIARHLLGSSVGARLILLSMDPRLDPLRRELAPLIIRSESWQALLRHVRACQGEAGHQAERLDPRPDPFPDQARFESLWPRERAVLELVGSGLGSRDIALALGVSLQTIETYRKSVSAKLGVSGARLVRIAVLYCCLHQCSLPGGVTGLAGDAQGWQRPAADAVRPGRGGSAVRRAATEV
jgi:DNA-binding NarL/FixJ family response regulator